MGAEKSKYQSDPWEPYVNKSDKDAGDEEAAAKDYTDVYGGSATYTAPKSGDAPTTVNMPTLDMAYTKAPDLVPSKPVSSGSSGKPTEDQTAFSVDLGAMRTAEQKFLNAVSTAKAGYETLRSTVTSAIADPDLFGQDVGTYAPDSNVTYTAQARQMVWTPDDLDSEGEKFATTTNAAMTEVLRTAAGAIEAMGAFTALLSNAAESYTYTDSSSTMPGT